MRRPFCCFGLGRSAQLAKNPWSQSYKPRESAACGLAACGRAGPRRSAAALRQDLALEDHNLMRSSPAVCGPSQGRSRCRRAAWQRHATFAGLSRARFGATKRAELRADPWRRNSSRSARLLMAAGEGDAAPRCWRCRGQSCELYGLADLLDVDEQSFWVALKLFRDAYPPAPRRPMITPGRDVR